MTYNTQMHRLSFYALFKLLRQHRKLAERRDPMFYTNKAARWIIGVVMGLMMLYLLMFAILFAFVANSSTSHTALEFIFGLMPFILSIDFGVRFIAQQTPSQIIKPYVLLPIPRYVCIDTFVIQSLMSWVNLLWFVMLVPFCIMSVVFSYGLWASISMLLLYYILVLADSQWYAICRTLVVGSQVWWVLPIVIYFGVYSVWIFGDFNAFNNFYCSIGQGLEHGNLLPHLVALLLLVGLSLVNRRIQYRNVWREMGKQKVTKMKTVSHFTALDRFGVIGEYMKIEIKSLMRNKNPRKSFTFAVVIVLILSLLVSFTDIYDSVAVTNFWCFYNYVVFGAMLLIRVMSYEGNYIDALMVHKENILKFLTTKYYFFCGLLLFPFVLMTPMVMVGKWNILMLFSYGIFTAGFQYFILMQLAVYNKQKIPLNENFISKSGVENNYMQVVAQMVTFIVPMAVISILEALLAEQTAWLIMMVIGLAFIATHKWWLANIYRRMMKRKYEHLMSFHT